MIIVFTDDDDEHANEMLAITIDFWWHTCSLWVVCTIVFVHYSRLHL